MAAGADCVFPFGLTDLKTISELVAALRSRSTSRAELACRASRGSMGPGDRLSPQGSPTLLY